MVAEFTSGAEVLANIKAVRARTAVWRIQPKFTKVVPKPEPTPSPKPKMVEGRFTPIIFTMEEGKNPRLSGHAILAAAALVTKTRVSSLTSHRRFMKYTVARQAFFYVARTHTDLSFPQIGRIAGGRDHSTVMSGLRKVEANWLSFEPIIRAIEQELGLSSDDAKSVDNVENSTIQICPYTDSAMRVA